jgi:hypothetical protein
MLRLLVESPSFFAGKRKCAVPQVASADKAAQAIISSLKISHELQPEAALIEIYDEAWGEYVHLENIDELKDKSKVRLSVKEGHQEKSDNSEEPPAAAVVASTAAEPTVAVESEVTTTNTDDKANRPTSGDTTAPSPTSASLQAQMAAYYDIDQSEEAHSLSLPEPIGCPPSSTTKITDTFRAQMLAIYTAKCPEKLGDVEGLVQKYQGREEEALRVVREKYGYAVQEKKEKGGPTRREPAPDPAPTASYPTASSAMGSSPPVKLDLAPTVQHSTY